MGQSSETQIRVQMVRYLIKAGLSNDQIRAELSPLYELHPEMLRSNRRKMKIPNPTESEPLQKHGTVDRKLFRRCPKCGGNGYRGACINCGLTYESDTYFDVRKNARVNR